MLQRIFPCSDHIETAVLILRALSYNDGTLQSHISIGVIRHCIITCQSDSRLRFGLEIMFTKHLQVVTTNQQLVDIIVKAMLRVKF
jgi:hypothetical protein